MKKAVLFLIASLMIAVTFPAGGCNSAHKGTPKEVRKFMKDSLQAVTARCQKVLDAAYMAQKDLGECDTLKGWEGYPVHLYEYYTGKDIKIGQPKRGLVYMLLPSAEKLAWWIVDAVWETNHEITYDSIERLRKFILWQSGAQFAVRGVVYEAMYTPEFYEPYVFKDGVTVYVADSTYVPADEHPTDRDLEYYLHLTNDQLKDNTGRYARICSTTRSQYYANGGTVNVGKDDKPYRDRAWLGVVAKLYQEAWKSDRNELIIAWAKVNLNQDWYLPKKK